jgi:hypothetical protein
MGSSAGLNRPSTAPSPLGRSPSNMRGTNEYSNAKLVLQACALVEVQLDDVDSAFARRKFDKGTWYPGVISEMGYDNTANIVFDEKDMQDQGFFLKDSKNFAGRFELTYQVIERGFEIKGVKKSKIRLAYQEIVNHQMQVKSEHKATRAQRKSDNDAKVKHEKARLAMTNYKPMWYPRFNVIPAPQYYPQDGHQYLFDGQGDAGNVYNARRQKSACAWDQVPQDIDMSTVSGSDENSIINRRARAEESIKKSMFKSYNTEGKMHFKERGNGSWNDVVDYKRKATKWTANDHKGVDFNYPPYRLMSREGRYKLRERTDVNVKQAEKEWANTSTATQSQCKVWSQIGKDVAALKTEHSIIDQFLALEEKEIEREKTARLELSQSVGALSGGLGGTFASTYGEAPGTLHQPEALSAMTGKGKAKQASTLELTGGSAARRASVTMMAAGFEDNRQGYGNYE